MAIAWNIGARAHFTSQIYPNNRYKSCRRENNNELFKEQFDKLHSMQRRAKIKRVDILMIIETLSLISCNSQGYESSLFSFNNIGFPLKKKTFQ